MIPDEAVVAAAKAIRKSDDATFDGSDDSEPTLTNLGAEELARAALEAAAQILMALAWERGVDAGLSCDSDRGHTFIEDNPYRSEA